MEAFTVREIRNCRRYYRYCYTLARPVDEKLLNSLELFGAVHIDKLSAYSSKFRDTFKVIFDDQIEINGTVADLQLYLTVSKQSPQLKQTLEELIHGWCHSASVSGQNH